MKSSLHELTEKIIKKRRGLEIDANMGTNKSISVYVHTRGESCHMVMAIQGPMLH